MQMLTDLADAPQGTIGYLSSNPFEFFHVLRALDRAPEQPMWGALLVPERAAEPMPAVICCHGSLGWRGHHHEYMVRYLELGCAVFRVHSFDARNVTSVVEDQMAVTMAMMLVDCYRALELLGTHPRIDSQRIGITGWSLGGSVALYAGFEPLRAAIVGESGPRFAAHLPIYPAAHVRPEETSWTSAPIRVLVGEADDYTPARFVTDLVRDLRPHGVRIEAVVYPDAHHSFDSVEPLTWLPEALRLGKKTTTLASDGHMFVVGSDGTRYPVDEPRQRQTSFSAAGNRGAHLGCHWRMRRRALCDAEGFFREQLSPKPSSG